MLTFQYQRPLSRFSQRCFQMLSEPIFRKIFEGFCTLSHHQTSRVFVFGTDSATNFGYLKELIGSAD